MTTPCCSTGNVGPVLRQGQLVITLPAYSHCQRTHVPLVVTLPAYSRAAHSLAVSVTPVVVSSWSSHMPCMSSLFSWYPSCLVWSRRSSHMPCVGSLFSRYPSRLAWSSRGLLTRLAWARSRSIRHSWRHLIAGFSHAWRGFVVLLLGSGCSAGSGVERGRSVERDNRLRGEESPD